MSRSVVTVACAACGTRTNIYEDQLGKVTHWLCQRRKKGAEPPMYRPVEDVEVR